MKLHAGSLYKKYLVLYGDLGTLEGNPVIEVENEDLQWDIYCGEIEFEIVDSTQALVVFNENTYTFPYRICKDPMKDLGFA